MCECSIKRSNGGEHLQTRKHSIACGAIVVEEVEKKQCCKCRGHKGLERFRGDDAMYLQWMPCSYRKVFRKQHGESEGVMAKVSCGN